MPGRSGRRCPVPRLGRRDPPVPAAAAARQIRACGNRLACRRRSHRRVTRLHRARGVVARPARITSATDRCVGECWWIRSTSQGRWCPDVVGARSRIWCRAGDGGGGHHEEFFQPAVGGRGPRASRTLRRPSHAGTRRATRATSVARGSTGRLSCAPLRDPRAARCDRRGGCGQCGGNGGGATAGILRRPVHGRWTP